MSEKMVSDVLAAYVQFNMCEHYELRLSKRSFTLQSLLHKAAYKCCRNND